MSFKTVVRFIQYLSLLLVLRTYKFVDIMKPLKNYYTCAGAVGCIAWKILAAEAFLVSAGCPGGGGVLLGIVGRGVPPGSPNPDPISDQNMPFSTPVFRPFL